MKSYNLAGDQIISSFLSYIQLEQEKGNQDYKGIVVRSIKSKKSIDNLHKLTAEQIRAISEHIYLQKKWK